MTSIQLYLERIEPDALNILHLFGLPDDVLGREDFSSTMSEEKDEYVCRMQWDDDLCVGHTAIPQHVDERLRELHRKRAARRLWKQTLYDLCKKKTGIQPPWGSLTGVRPSHLLYEALEQGMDMASAEQYVASQFDVTAEKTSLLKETVQVQMLLPKPDDVWFDAYIGIPFCTTRCTYCSFSSGEIGTGRLVEPYLAALEKEMRFTAAQMRLAGKKLRALYIGGGTPTALNESQFNRLMALTMELFPDACEYTVEAGRPDTITKGKLETIAGYGVDRISINPQTMNETTLRLIGRGHTVEQVYDAYALARECGIGHINMDVIAGLPGESIREFERTMEAARCLHPESLTVHTLAIKRSSKMAMGEWHLPDSAEAAAMVQLGRKTAHALGMKPYYLYRQKYMAGNLENVGYALPGHACLYNVDIMEETSHIAAMGAGGISKRVYPEEGHIERAPNVSNIETYIDRIEQMCDRKRMLFPALT